MSYKYASGSVRRGDIYFEDDRQGSPTYIDFGQDTITLRPSGGAQLYVEDEKVGIGTTSPDHTLHVKSPGTCHVKIESEAGYEAALKIKSGGQSSAYVWQPGSTSDLRFYLDGADVMHLDSDGNVGIGTTTPYSTLQVAGSLQFKVNAVSGNTTLDDTYHVVAVDCNSDDVTITLPSVSESILGRQYIIKRADTGGSGNENSLTIARNGANIDGAGSDLGGIDNGTSHTLICLGGAGWIIVDKYVGI